MKSHSKLTLILKCEPKSVHTCRRQVVHPRPQTPQGESVAKYETPLLIIISIACKCEVHIIVLEVLRLKHKILTELELYYLS